MESKVNFRQPDTPVAGNVSKKHSTGIRLRMLCFFSGGRERARTFDLYHVKVAL